MIGNLDFWVWLGFFWIVFLEAFGLFGVHKVNGEQACSLSSLLHPVWHQGWGWAPWMGTSVGWSLGILGQVQARHVEMEFQFAFPSLSCSLFRLENNKSQQHDMVRESWVSGAVWQPLKQHWKPVTIEHHCNAQTQPLFYYLKYLEYCHL